MLVASLSTRRLCRRGLSTLLRLRVNQGVKAKKQRGCNMGFESGKSFMRGAAIKLAGDLRLLVVIAAPSCVLSLTVWVAKLRLRSTSALFCTNDDVERFQAILGFTSSMASSETSSRRLAADGKESGGGHDLKE